MTDEQRIEDYRKEVAQHILKMAQEAGRPMTEDEALRLTYDLDDEMIALGMDWNTPEEVAQTMRESGLI